MTTRAERIAARTARIEARRTTIRNTVEPPPKPPFADSLLVYDRQHNITNSLMGMLVGRPTFLIGGGPSAKAYPLNDVLTSRGVFSLGVNNVCGWVHTSAFVCSDPPEKFHHGIWLDPTVMKFIPKPKFCDRDRGKLRAKIGDTFQPLTYRGLPVHTIDCPNTWGFYREVEWDYGDSFFTREAATWGNNKKGAEKTGKPNILNTLLLAIRLLYHLGSRRIYLVGVDFNMSDAGYSFDQGRTQKAVGNNNNQYITVNGGLCEMVENGVFKKFGLEMYNCNANSSLRAFPHVPFDVATRDVLRDFPTEPFSLTSWYEKNNKPNEMESGN